MLNPFACATSIQEDLLSYITSSLPIGNHATQVKLGEAFYREWKSNLFKGPFVEALPKYETVSCLAEQFASRSALNISERSFSTLLGRSAGLNWNDAERRSTVRDRVWSEYPAEEQAERSETTAQRLWKQPLYWHQWEALRTVVEKHRSIVVATGTGSGKTECYLLPLLYMLITEDPSVRAQSGVRAILLFPMNALVEDQMRRLRKLLFWVNLASWTLPPSAPEKLRRQVTFGRHTGDTPVDDADRERLQPPDHIRELGEKVTRADMQQEPPDILVTNFSMLEYALLRSQDQVLFRNPALFRMLVLDEVHTYSGTVGAEVAMLLRRLRAFLEGKSTGKSQTPVFVGTSATLGSGPDAKEKMATFASGLFGVPFATNQVLQGKTLPVAVNAVHPEKSQVRNLAAGLANFVDRRPALLQLISGRFAVDDVPEWESKIAEDLEEVAVLLDACWEGMERDTGDFEALSSDPEGRSRELLGRISQASAAIGLLINLIQDSDAACLDLEQLALDYFRIADRSDVFFPVASKALSVLLTIMANASVKGRTLLPLRFHHFVSEQKEGLLCMNPCCKRASTAEGGTDGWWSSLFISHTIKCPSCNSLVFPLVICRRCGFSYLEAWRQPYGHFFLPEKEEPDAQMFRLLFRPVSQLTESAEELDARQRALCLTCGHWFESAAGETGKEAQAAHTECTNANIIEVFEWSKDQADFEMLACPICEQHWYSDREVVTGPVVSPFAAATIFLEDLAAHVAPGQSRSKLISFSDTRQQAAKLAERLQKSNRDYVFRQLIYRVLPSSEAPLKTLELFDVLFREVRDDERKRQLFIDDPATLHNNLMLQQSLADLLFREAVSAYYTLETLGLVEVAYGTLLCQLAERVTLPPFWRRCIPEGEKKSLIRLVLDWGLRFRHCAASAVNAIPYADASLQRWKIFRRRVTGPQYGRRDQTEAAFFLGRADSRNPLFNFMLRLNKKYQSRHSVWTVGREEFNGLLEVLWRAMFSEQRLLTTGTNGQEATRELIATRPREADCATLQLNLNALLWAKSDDTGTMFRCDVCGRLSHYTLGQVCPVRWCLGTLVHVSGREIDQLFSPTRHYRRLIRERHLQPLNVEEHTAEIANPRRLEIERLFKRDDEESIDVISGSTTFELGVDLGTISSVFLANLPPRVSNYRQRAGRAGRREGMIPFVLSYVRQRPHDQYFWRDLRSFISGPVPIPKFRLSSQVVLQRHGFSALLALVLASYERTGGQTRSLWGPPWREVSQFLGDPSNAARIRLAANTPTSEIPRAISRIYDGVDETTRAKLAAPPVCAEFFDRVSKLEPLLRLRADEGCIKLLGDYGILPTYSFPIYVDELRLHEVQPNDRPRCDLSLTRDRRISLVEYYPGRTITAGKTHIRSKGIWAGSEQKQFRRCSNCGDLTFAPNAPNVCGHCGGPSLPMTALIPWGGYYGCVTAEGFAPEVELDDVASSEVFFDPANDPRPTPRPEGKGIQVAIVDANLMRAARMRQFSPRPGSKKPLRLEQRTETDAGAPRSPANCLGIPDAANVARAQTFHLLHEFTTDIARIRIGKGPVGQTIQSSVKLLEGLNSSKRSWYRDSFWKTLAEALLIASAKFLDIDEVSNAELGVTFRTEALENCLDDRELILYDTAPGGAGYSTEVAANLKGIFERAARILRDCSCGDSCYRCLRSYRNQWIHSRLPPR